MKAYTLVTLGIIASLIGCSDDGTNMSPMGTPGGTGAAGTTAGATAGTAGTAGSSGTASVPVGGSGGSSGTSGTTAGTSGGAPAAGATAAGSGGSGGTAAGSGGGGSGGAGGSGGGGGTGGDSMPTDEGTGGTDALPPIAADKALPIVFVHGFAGSAQQFQSQAQRYVANGFPQERIRAFEHDGQGTNITGFVEGLDAVIDGVIAEFKTPKVYLIGHSRGTSVSSQYLSNSTRAAKVAKYIAVDGSPCPSVVPCITPNQAMFAGQKHVEVCTSKESFAMQYEFLMGSKPQVVDIVRQRAPVVISGRVVNFPANTGRAGTTLKVFEVTKETGARAKPDPLGTFMIADDGSWGPVTVSPDKYYEFELTGSSGLTSHFYPQRFLRSSDLVRFLSGPPDSPARMNTNTSDKHAAMVVSRQREWLPADVLEVSTKSPSGGDQPVVDAIKVVGGAASSIGIHIHDAASSPGNSTLMALPYFSMQAFQNGVDVFMPAADPPDGVITLRNFPRGDMAKPQVMNVPNWKSSAHFISVMFSDFPLD